MEGRNGLKQTSRPVLITGIAGFIGAAVAQRLIDRGENVIGIDNLNSYYTVSLKISRITRLVDSVRNNSQIRFIRMDIEDGEGFLDVLEREKPRAVIHLAAQAGVRYSIENPTAYFQSNLVGFGNVLEGCRQQEVEHLVYASSSSVYGNIQRYPFREKQPANHPISLYAATKRANELMAHTYSHLYDLPATGLRFFTVYGPWGRPDMAPMLFANAIIQGKPINVFNGGHMARDFTYIDDISEGVVRCLDKPATSDLFFDNRAPNASTSMSPHRIFNVGSAKPVKLLEFISLLEEALGKKAIINCELLQPGDMISTEADISALEAWIGFRPKVEIEEGLRRFASWINSYTSCHHS